MERKNRWIERIAAELRRPVPVDPDAKRRLMAEVRRVHESRRTGLWGWLVRPRPVAVTPLAVLGGAVVLAAVIFGLAVRPGAGPVTPAAEGARPVQFVFVAEAASRVALVGDFNDWDKTVTPLRRRGPGDVWSVVVRLAPGPYRYAFVVDGQRWVADASAPRASSDDFGLPSSLILVEESRT